MPNAWQFSPLHHCHGLLQGRETGKQQQADWFPVNLPEPWGKVLQSCQDLYAVSTSSESLYDRCTEASEPRNRNKSVRSLSTPKFKDSSPFNTKNKNSNIFMFKNSLIFIFLVQNSNSFLFSLRNYTPAHNTSRHINTVIYYFSTSSNIAVFASRHYWRVILFVPISIKTHFKERALIFGTTKHKNMLKFTDMSCIAMTSSHSWIWNFFWRHSGKSDISTENECQKSICSNVPRQVRQWGTWTVRNKALH